jgi:hypothetical protein
MNAAALVDRIPGLGALKYRVAVWRLQRRRRRRWEGARACVVSFPKSGRTWLNVMLARALGGPGLEVPGVLFTHDDADKPDRPWAPDPARYAGRKIVFLVRDPRDVLVSYHAHRTRRDRTWQGSLSAFARHPGYGIDRVLAFMNGWWAVRAVVPEFLLVRYEDLHADPRKTLARVLGFLGAPVDARALERAVEEGRFARMQARERAGDFDDRRLAPGDAADPQSFKVREGKVGGWREAFGPEDRAYLAERVRSGLDPALGYAP